ncbi:MAG: hypothetical protein R2698_04560 [Microthrixaceae bacterium]
MVGAVIIVIVLVVVIPVAVLVTGGALAGVIGYFVQRDVDETHEGSELVDLNG